LTSKSIVSKVWSKNEQEKSGRVFAIPSSNLDSLFFCGEMFLCRCVYYRGRTIKAFIAGERADALSEKWLGGPQAVQD
jgi:hypothetical protein